MLTHEKDKFGIQGDASMDFGPTHERSRAGERGHRQGRPLPDEEEQDHRDRRLGHADRRHGEVDVELNDGSTADLHLRQPDHRHRRHHPADPRDVAVASASSPTRSRSSTAELPGVDRHRRLRRDRRRVRLRDDELRRRRDDRGVPRPDGADRGRRHLQGAAQALQEARREGAARRPRSSRSTTPAPAATRSRSPSRPPTAASSRCSRPTRCSQAIGFAPRVEGYGLEAAGVELTERGADRDRRLRPHQRRARLRDRRRAPAS